MTALVVGIGNMGTRHVRVLGELGLSVITVDPCVKDATYSSVDEVTELIDVACVAVPIEYLGDVALKVIEHVTPRVLIVEKPGAPSSQELSRVNDAAARRGVRVIVGYTERHNPVVRAFARLLSAGTVPPVAHVAATRLSPTAALQPLIPHALDLAVHDIDIAWRYAHEATFAWCGGHGPHRQRHFTCIHTDNTATFLDLDNLTINGIEVRGEEPLKREWRAAINANDGHVPLWPEIEVLEAAEKLVQNELVAA